MPDIRDMQEERHRIVTEMRGVLDAAEKEKRDLTNEEEAKYKEMSDTQMALKRQIDREVELRDIERETVAGSLNEPGSQKRNDPTGGSEAPDGRAVAAFRDYLVNGGPVPQEMRDLQADSDTKGGILVPKQFVEGLIQRIDEMLFIRNKATVITVANAGSVGVASLDDDPDDAEWTAEIKTGSADNAMSFGARELTPHPLAKRIKVSETLLRRVPQVEGIVQQQLAFQHKKALENGFLTGSGAQQPLGVFTASAQGISTARDISTGNTATGITTDGLKSAKYGVRSVYRGNASWLFHTDAIAQIDKLKDGESNYIWQPSLVAGQPDKLLGLPVDESEFAPNTFTTGQYVGLLGDWSYYWIVDALDMTIKRLNELYAEENKIGFIGRLESDGMPVLEEAFARVKLG